MLCEETFQPPSLPAVLVPDPAGREPAEAEEALALAAEDGGVVRVTGAGELWFWLEPNKRWRLKALVGQNSKQEPQYVSFFQGTGVRRVVVSGTSSTLSSSECMAMERKITGL